jgi:hypothetical protein
VSQRFSGGLVQAGRYIYYTRIDKLIFESSIKPTIHQTIKPGGLLELRGYRIFRRFRRKD